MNKGQDQIVEQIGQLADRAERQEQEIETLRQRQNRLADELGQLVADVFRISRSSRLWDQAGKARDVLEANMQEPSSDR